jgi:hypothetical protein
VRSLAVVLLVTLSSLAAGQQPAAEDYPYLQLLRTEGHVYRAPSSTYYSAEVYCYVVARDGSGLKVLWRGKDSVRIYHDKKVRGGTLRT